MIYYNYIYASDDIVREAENTRGAYKRYGFIGAGVCLIAALSVFSSYRNARVLLKELEE